MSDKREDPPVPRLVPKGPLRAAGNDYARSEQARQVNHQHIGTPQPEKSPLERTIDAERKAMQTLQINSLESQRRYHEKELNASKEQFRVKHAQLLDRLKSDREAIEARRNTGLIRGLFNRIGGRAAEDQARLRELDQADQQMQKQQEEHLAPLREQHSQQRADLEREHHGEREAHERTINQAREAGHFPDYARLSRDTPDRDPGRER